MMRRVFAVVLVIVMVAAGFVAPVWEVRASVAVGEIIEFGGRNWRVLDVQGSYAKLLHETVIVDQPYHHTLEDVTWATSSSRAWLNGEFLNGFSATDQARIRQTYVVNNDNPWTFSDWTGHWNHTPGGANTTDRIFLLSIDEVVRYFGGSELLELGIDESNRRCCCDGGPIIPGLRREGILENNHISEARIARNEQGSASWWWLRSPGYYPNSAAIVSPYGYLNVQGIFVNFSHSGGGLRPALWLRLEDTPAAPPAPAPTPPPPPAQEWETMQFGGRDWRVLDVQGGYAKLLHETVIAYQPYHHTEEDVTWSTSSSRAWLNGEFLNGFSAADQARIRQTYVVNNDNPWTYSDWTGHWNHTPGGANTTDRIFLLSIDEVVRYFGDSGTLDRGRDENARLCCCDGNYQGSSIPWTSGIFDRYCEARIARNEQGLASGWWLRSPGFFPHNAANVYAVGFLDIFGIHVNDSSFEGGLRPALWLALDTAPEPVSYEDEPEPEEIEEPAEESTPPEPSQYIHTPPASQDVFTPPPAALAQVTDTTTATTAISNTVMGLTPEQRQSGDALNTATLHIENLSRRGTTQTMPADGGINTAALVAGAQTAGQIRQETNAVLQDENISLLRETRTNINFVSDEPDLQIYFPDDVSAVDFDNVTVESDFAAVTVNREYIPEGGEISVRPVAGQHHAGEGIAGQSRNDGVDGDDVDAHGADIRHSGLDPESPPGGILSLLLDFWSVTVVIVLLIAWVVLLSAGKKLRVWVVPTFAAIAIAANVGTVFLLDGDDVAEAVAIFDDGTVFDDTAISVYSNGVEVEMTEGMRATLSLPVNGTNPEFLVLVNEAGEIQHSRYNPSTGTIDGRIRTSGVYTLRENAVSFADIENRSQLMQDVILQLAARGIMQGTVDGYFHPDDSITRTEFISAIVMAFDMLDLNAQAAFEDISPGEWYYHAIATAERENLISGFEDNTFRGNLEIPKDQLIVIAARTLAEQMGYRYPENAEYFLARFLDRAEIAEWSEDGIALSTATNVLLHRQDSMFAPQSIKTRGDAAIVLYRVFSRVW